MATASPSRTAFVMAAGKGLGRGAAEALGRDGCAVAVCGRSAGGLEDVMSALQQAGTAAHRVVADVSRAAELEQAFVSVDAAFGRLDVLVANAGGPPPGSFLEADDEAWRAGFELTLMSAVRAMRLAVPRMRAQGGGRIVVIGSSSVKQPIENLVISNAFRPALLGVVKTLAREVAAAGITVNIVSPGRIDTDRVRSLDDRRAATAGISYDEIRSRAERAIPTGRYGEPTELGALVAFLASDQAAYVTGQSILIDGGLVSAL